MSKNKDKYHVVFNDGEHIAWTDTLEEAREVKNDIFHRFISRYAVIYHNGVKL